MKYELFSRLYNEAMDYDDIDIYIAERGWQDWMDQYCPADSDDWDDSDEPHLLVKILNRIYELANMSFKQMRAETGMSFKRFSEIYGIPSRTVQDWEYEQRKIPAYTKKMLAYTMLEGEIYE